MGVGVASAGSDASGTPSRQCRDGANATQATVPGSSVGFETGPTTPGATGVTVCYSDTANGTPSRATGGYVHARQDQNGATGAQCVGDPGTALTVNCSASGEVTTGDDGNPNTVGRTVAARVLVTNTAVRTTGAFVEPLVTVDPWGATTDASATTGNGTCLFVDGAGTCTTSVSPFDVRASNGDLAPTTSTGTYGCVGVNGSCTVPLVGATATVGHDAVNPTVDGRVLSVSVTRDTGRQCVRIGITCP
ncbi:MAG TPA: hypothetical protein VM938_11330 [Acidimicrobiales bacterium]|nr:hypothetical protein [Acidimicrobiales bacterium]